MQNHFRCFLHCRRTLTSSRVKRCWFHSLLLWLVKSATMLVILLAQRQQKERYVLRMWEAVYGEERCLTTLKTAVRKTTSWAVGLICQTSWNLAWREEPMPKVHMTWNFFFRPIWKAFQNTKEWSFSFWNIFFRFRDIDVFLLCKLDQWWRHIVCNWKW